MSTPPTTQTKPRRTFKDRLASVRSPKRTLAQLEKQFGRTYAADEDKFVRMFLDSVVSNHIEKTKKDMAETPNWVKKELHVSRDIGEWIFATCIANGMDPATNRLPWGMRYKAGGGSMSVEYERFDVCVDLELPTWDFRVALYARGYLDAKAEVDMLREALTWAELECRAHRNRRIEVASVRKNAQRKNDSVRERLGLMPI
jgi:hypothetical protein